MEKEQLMKKTSIVVVLLLVLLLNITILASCNIGSIEFNATFSPIEGYDNINLEIEFGNLFQSREELDKFYEKELFDNIDKENELKKYDDTYFKNNSLLIVIFWGDKNCNKTVKKITQKNSQLWITVETGSMKEFNEIARFFIEVSKEDVSEVKEIDYKIVSIM